MSQHTVSIILKFVVSIFALMGISLQHLYFPIYNNYYMEEYNIVSIGDFPFPVLAFVVSFVYIVYYIFLILFWRVCTHIGRYNSFSPINSKLFRLMAVCGFSVSFVALAASLILAISSYEKPGNNYFLTFFVGVFFIGLFIGGLCETLSRLIQHAYNVKKENELTI